MRKLFFALAVMLFATGINTSFQVISSEAKVIVREKVQFYTVTGDTGAEIYRSMLKNGPDHGGGLKEVLASTSFKFNFENDVFKIRRNRCVLTNLDIIIDVTYTYPKWTGSRKASNETKRAWENFSKVAVWHEKQHVKITKKFAKEYERAVKKSRRRAANECATESTGEKVRTSFAIRKHENRHRRFDRRDLRKGGKGYKALLALVKAK